MSIEIPVSMIYDWDAKISLQTALHQKPLTYSELLLNFSLATTSMFSSVVTRNAKLEGKF